MQLSKEFLVWQAKEITDRGNLMLVFEPHEGEVVIMLGVDLLSSFHPFEQVLVGGEALSPYWGEPLCEEVDGWPAWVTQARLKTVPRGWRDRVLRELSEVNILFRNRLQGPC